MMRARMAMATLLALAACDGRKSAVDLPELPMPLTIWNSTQHPLEEVRVHSGTEYGNATNLLSENLPHDERTLVDIIAGQHVTVVRRNVDGGQPIAFTTASGLNVRTPGYVLQVFQESFRLHEPEFHDGGNDDGDANDGGPTDGGEPEGGDA